MWSHLLDRIRWWFPRYRAKYILWNFLLCVVVVLVLYGWTYVTR
jgi:hypothetical protein